MQTKRTDTPNETSLHELFNDATCWLQQARGVTSTLADLIHEADTVDCAQLALSLEAIAAMMRAGIERVGEAHARWSWDTQAPR
jgi:hypothetical protein